MDSIKYILLRNSVIGVRILLFSFLNHTYLLASLVFEAILGCRVHLSAHTAVLHFFDCECNFFTGNELK